MKRQSTRATINKEIMDNVVHLLFGHKRHVSQKVQTPFVSRCLDPLLSSPQPLI